MLKRITALYVLAGFASLAAGISAQAADAASSDHATMSHAAHMKMMADAQRQEQVTKRGKDVMPFRLAATTHVFAKRADGGTQQVLVKDSTNTTQINLAKEHLKEIQAQFLQGDFSGPTHIHGQAMPGLSELKAARPGQIAIAYQDVAAGGQLSYATTNPSLVAALHRWFDAQLSDHGADAVARMAAHNTAAMHDHGTEIGTLGQPGITARVVRTVRVTMSDKFRYSPDSVRINQGETIRFIVRNAGRIRHEMVLGTVASIRAHDEMMKQHPGMHHVEPNMISLKAGAQGEIIWQFTEAGQFQFACLEPGHFDAGMKGVITVAGAPTSTKPPAPMDHSKHMH